MLFSPVFTFELSLQKKQLNPLFCKVSLRLQSGKQTLMKPPKFNLHREITAEN